MGGVLAVLSLFGVAWMIRRMLSDYRTQEEPHDLVKEFTWRYFYAYIPASTLLILFCDSTDALAILSHLWSIVAFELFMHLHWNVTGVWLPEKIIIHFISRIIRISCPLVHVSILAHHFFLGAEFDKHCLMQTLPLFLIFLHMSYQLIVSGNLAQGCVSIVMAVISLPTPATSICIRLPVEVLLHSAACLVLMRWLLNVRSVYENELPPWSLFTAGTRTNHGRHCPSPIFHYVVHGTCQHVRGDTTH
mmetsp:Transcript_1005/g.1857  ORF Transcript_1005/g.1857 Transcript_1005/m.1857 type:complete len:247 (-) Transcript_1005:665-1405(-)